MRPIPMRLLKDDITYYELDKNSRYEGTYKAPIQIKNVLINLTKTVKKDTPADQSKAQKGTVFLDAINTKPFMDLVYGSKIVDQLGNEFFVLESKAVQAFKLHHYEVGLM
jgi:hypothetical protein